MLPDTKYFLDELSQACHATSGAVMFSCPITGHVKCAIWVIRVIKLDNEEIVIRSNKVFNWSHVLLNKEVVFKKLCDQFILDMKTKLP